MSEGSDLRQLFEQLLAIDPAEREARARELVAVTAERERLLAMVEAEELAPADEAASPNDERDHPWPGDSVGAYRLLAPIGDGGMGSVWAAESRSAPDVRVAVKFATGVGVDRAEARGRLEQERRVLAALDHPGVVRLIDGGEAGARGPFVVLPLLRGRPLDEFARGAGEAQVRRVVARLARALEHVHSRGFVHRDIKPSNVLVDEEGWPVLIDLMSRSIHPL